MAPLNQRQILLKKALAKKPKTKRLSGFGPKPSAAFSKPQPAAPAAVHPRRRIRVVFDDPDATDSDSDDEQPAAGASSTKRFFEVFIGKPPARLATPAAAAAACANAGKAAEYRGVRLRKWGKWAAEIRNPFTGTRQWLGTFDTAAAASAAYQSASRSFAEEKCRRRGQAAATASPASFSAPTPTASSSSSTSAAPFAHPSPSSVLESAKPGPKPPSPEVEVEAAQTPNLAASESAQLPDDPEFYQDLLRGLQLPDIDPMDFRAGLDALDVSDVPDYLDDEQDLLLGDFADEDLELDIDLDDIGDDFPEIPGCDFGRGMDDFLQTVDFCV